MEEERDELDNYILELVDLMWEDRLEVRCDKFLENGNYRTRDTREKRSSSIEEQKTLREEDGPLTGTLMCGSVYVCVL